MKVLILLSTYNGQRYLPELLDSLEKQSGVDTEILVRDDGSKDDTVEILRKYQQKYGNLHIHPDINQGACKSFLSLIDLASKKTYFDYAAFCDQDDVWLPNKLSAAVTLMQREHTDFYYSPYQLVDKNLQPLHDNDHFLPIKQLGPSLVYNSVTGCTILCSKKVIDMAASSHPAQIMMHDSWIFKVALANQCGVSVDNKSYILYRQHGDNVIGGTETAWNRLKRRWYNFSHPRCERSLEAEELYRNYYDVMNHEDKSLMDKIHQYKKKNLFQRFLIAFDPLFRTDKTINDLIFKIAILTKRF